MFSKICYVSISFLFSIYYSISTQILIHLLSYYSIGIDGIGMDTGSNVQYPATQETRGTSHSRICGIICEMFSKICYFLSFFCSM